MNSTKITPDRKSILSLAWVFYIFNILYADVLFVAPPAIYYIFFAVVEIITSLFIIWYAWTWTNTQENDLV